MVPRLIFTLYVSVWEDRDVYVDRAANGPFQTLEDVPDDYEEEAG